MDAFWFNGEKVLALKFDISNIIGMARPKLEAFETPAVELAEFAKALAHPARIRILRFLAGRGEVACMEIVAALPLSQPSCSRHVNELRKAGLLMAREDGPRVWCRVNTAALNGFCSRMNEVLHPSASSTEQA